MQKEETAKEAKRAQPDPDLGKGEPMEVSEEVRQETARKILQSQTMEVM